ncbi:MAG TPA: TetR/AcrR family transcriptional regulator [Labilithrix sp.]|nr:TetR/AcrR family transcriptional regulator [Labilithrix sp.]
MQGPAQREPARGAEETDSYRLRLLEGLAAAVLERGYAKSTIADIVKNARVSKRTFYEHFADKEECFLALYEAAIDFLIQGIDHALRAPAKSWEAQLEAGLDAYLAPLETNPTLTRACLLEIQAAGPRGLEYRLRGHERFALLLRSFVERIRSDHPELRPLSASMATAVVGGIDELLLLEHRSVRGSSVSADARLTELRETATELIRAVIGAPPRLSREKKARPT